MYGIANTKDEFVIFLGKTCIQIKYYKRNKIFNRIKIYNYDESNTKEYVNRMYNPYWELLLTIYE